MRSQYRDSLSFSKGVAMPGHPGRIGTLKMVGGATSLDFFNTANGRREGGTLGRVEENLQSPADFIEWSARAGLLDGEQKTKMERLAGIHPEKAWQALQQVLNFRETTYRLFERLGKGICDPCGLDELNAQLVASAALRRVELVSNQYALHQTVVCAPEMLFGGLLGKITLSAVEILLSGNAARVRLCDACDCDWLFLDKSKSGRRRWCQMEICGNREKGRRRLSNEASLRRQPN